MLNPIRSLAAQYIRGSILSSSFPSCSLFILLGHLSMLLPQPLVQPFQESKGAAGVGGNEGMMYFCQWEAASSAQLLTWEIELNRIHRNIKDS